MGFLSSVMWPLAGGVAGLLMVLLGLQFRMRHTWRRVATELADHSEAGSRHFAQVPRVIHGEGVFAKALFYDEPALGPIYGIEPTTWTHGEEPAILVCTVHGAVYLNPDGREIARIPFERKALDVRPVDIGGSLHFFVRIAGDRIALLDPQGRRCWTRGWPRVCSMVCAIAAGDMDGDGEPEFAAGGLFGLSLYDRAGNRQWHRRGSHVFAADIVQDGTSAARMVYTSRGRLHTIDASGCDDQPLAPRWSAFGFSACPWPTVGGAPHILNHAEEAVFLLALDGTISASFTTPSLNHYARILGTVAHAIPGHLPGFAILAGAATRDRSALYVFDETRALVYHETLGHAGTALAAAPQTGAAPEALLVGGTGRIWRYGAP